MKSRRSIIPVFVPHLGCPNDCVFCNQHRISGSLVPASPESVQSALENALELVPAGTETELAFYGGTFTAIPPLEQERLLGAALPFLNKGKISSIRVSTRPDAIDKAALDRLKSFGVQTIELGAQSMRDEILMLSKRGHSAQDVIAASALIKSFGFNLILQMMTGLPGDDISGAKYTSRQICDLCPDGVRIYPTVIIKNTTLYDMWTSEAYQEHTVEDAVCVCSQIVPIFEEHKIPIIRLGLNPTEDLSGGDAVAGAYHPALGELVYSRILREKMSHLLKGIAADSGVTIGVHPSKLSQAIGQKRCNLDMLRAKHSLKSLKITEISCGTEEIRLLSIAKL